MCMQVLGAREMTCPDALALIGSAVDAGTVNEHLLCLAKWLRPMSHVALQVITAVTSLLKPI